MPDLTNLRLDPFERTGWPEAAIRARQQYYNWFVYEFWRFVFVQQEVGKLAQTAIEFPPMQKGASFNLEAVKEQIEKATVGTAVNSAWLRRSMAGAPISWRLLCNWKGINHVNRSFVSASAAASCSRRWRCFRYCPPRCTPPRRWRRRNAIRCPSWNDGATKTSILDFVARVTTQGGP